MATAQATTGKTATRARSGTAKAQGARGVRASPGRAKAAKAAAPHEAVARVPLKTFAAYKPLGKAGFDPLTLQVLHLIGTGTEMATFPAMQAQLGLDRDKGRKLQRRLDAMAEAEVIALKDGGYYFSQGGRALWNACRSIAGVE
jgi:hypothetical protein